MRKTRLALGDIIPCFDGGLSFAGAVGTGFNERVAAALWERLDKLRSTRCVISGLNVAGAVWVVPDLEAEIACGGVTTAGELRHASFKGLADGLAVSAPLAMVDFMRPDQRDISQTITLPDRR